VIKAVGVVIPAHDEEDLLPACLAAAIRAAGQLTGLPVQLVVVADACCARNVGAARDAGMREVLTRTRRLSAAEVWLATTDADTLVPPCWLSRQLHYAERGWDAVIGTVSVTDWSEYPPEMPPLFQRHYGSGQGTHPHVHGANLGFRAAAYLQVGGFGSCPTAEDHALVNELTAAGSRILRTREVSVVTSARRRARAPDGFSQLLSALAAAQIDAG
jgi:hypothetical protein